MSGVYIPNVNLPESCDECPHPTCRLWQSVNGGERHEKCPIVPVPEHGDLIDKQYAYQNTMTLGERTRKIVLKQIDALPVVIPSNKECEE